MKPASVRTVLNPNPTALVIGRPRRIDRRTPMVARARARAARAQNPTSGTYHQPGPKFSPASLKFRDGSSRRTDALLTRRDHGPRPRSAARLTKASRIDSDPSTID